MVARRAREEKEGTSMLQSVKLAENDYECPIRQILGRLGGRWTLEIILTLGNGSRHFADLERGIAGVSRRMLTLTLRALERDGLVQRTPAPRPGAPVRYALTPLGVSLEAQLQALTEWSRIRRDEIFAARAAFDAL
jgi:DNA-binding HxlR family transcriptional regulator